MSQDSLPYRPNVCLLILNAENMLFLGERAGCPGIWQFPQGGVRDISAPIDSVYREIEEEIGLTQDELELVAELSTVNEYDFENPPDYFKGRFRGQRQSFWALRFRGDDSRIRLDLHEPELMSWRWCTAEEVERLAEPKRLKGYRPALAELKKILDGG